MKIKYGQYLSSPQVVRLNDGLYYWGKLNTGWKSLLGRLKKEKKFKLESFNFHTYNTGKFLIDIKFYFQVLFGFPTLII